MILFTVNSAKVLIMCSMFYKWITNEWKFFKFLTIIVSFSIVDMVFSGNRIYLFCVAIIIAFSAKGISLYFAKLIMINVSEEVKKILQTDMLKSFIKADTEIIESKHSGKYISNLNFDVNQITKMLADAFLSIFKDGLTLIGLLCVMFIQNWKLSLIAIIRNRFRSKKAF